MTATPAKTNLLDLDRGGLEAFFAARGEKAFRASQVLKWVHQQGVADFAQMTNLSKALRQRLGEECEIRVPEVAADRLSRDGTRKWLLRLGDGNCIETVFIPEDDRGTLCVSSQVGCVLECAFCATGHQGFGRNLTASEIIGQLWLANSLLGAGPGDERIVSNVVLMGMGEPLLNFDNVITAARVMLDDFAYGLSKRRVTLSTAGVVPGIDRLAGEADLALAVSLHATRDDLRDRLVPINRKYPLAQLMAACRRYVARDGRRRVTFEYVMLDGVNDSVADARALVRLLEGVPAKVNLIPYNPFPGGSFAASSPEAVTRFWEVLMAASITTITRKTRGEDIAAACGQLVGEVHDRTHRQERFRLAVERKSA